MHWTQAIDLQLGTLRALQREMAHRHWVPITMEELQAELENIRNDTTPSKKLLARCIENILDSWRNAEVSNYRTL